MRKAISTIAMMSLTAAAWAVVGLAPVGCDKMQSETRRGDQAVESQMKDARAKGDLASDATRAQLQKIAAIKASSLAQANAKATLAQSESAAAIKLLADVEPQEALAQQLIGNIQGLAARVQSNAATIASVGKQDPKQLLAEVDKKKAEFTQRAADLDKESKRLAGEIDSRESQKRKLGTDKDEASKHAAELIAAADKAQGQPWLDQYNKALDLREQAENLSTRIDALTAEVVPLQTQLDALKAQAAIVDGSLKVCDTHTTQIKAAWDDAQKLLAARTADSKDARDLQGAADAPDQGGLAVKAKGLADLLAQIDQKRVDAANLLTSSAKHFEDAAHDAALLQKDLTTILNDDRTRTNPELKKTLDAIISSQSVDGYRLFEARALQLLGDAQTRRFALTTSYLQAGETANAALAAAGLEPVADLKREDLTKIRDAARTAADQAYADALGANLLDKLVESTSLSASAKAQALVCRMFVAYGDYRVTAKSDMLDKAKLAREAANKALNELTPARSGEAPVDNATTNPTTAPAAAPSPVPTVDPLPELGEKPLPGVG